MVNKGGVQRKLNTPDDLVPCENKLITVCGPVTCRDLTSMGYTERQRLLEIVSCRVAYGVETVARAVPCWQSLTSLKSVGPKASV